MYYLDISRTVDRGTSSIPTGIDRVEIEYIKFFQRKKTTGFIFCETGILYIVNNDWLNKAITTNAKATKSDFMQNSFPINNDINGVYINISHHGVSLKNPIYSHSGRRKYIYFLHDLIPIQNPEYVRAGDSEAHNERLLIMTSLAENIICNSEYTKSSLIDWCIKNDITIPETTVAKLAASFSPKENIRIFPENSFKYYLYVSTLEPRKNHLALLHTWRRLIEDKEFQSKLVFVGKRGWNNEDLFRYLDQNQSIKPYVRELSSVSDSFLSCLIAQSHAVLFPSLNEGWGLPVTEAAQYGKKIICSNIPALIEASAGNAVFLDPLCVDQWVKEIRRTDALPVETNFIKIDWNWENHFNLIENLFSRL